MKKIPFFHYLTLVFGILMLAACSAQPQEPEETVAEQAPEVTQPAPEPEASDLDGDYERLDKLLADITRQMNQPNILKSDIERGWYLGSRSDRKYGTPDGWIFIEDGENSKWISPNALEEEDYIDSRRLCRETAGSYVASCLDSSDSDCQYTENSFCECLEGTKWMEVQGCILVNSRGSYVAINAEELSQGFYLGLPNQKKLNTPSDWVWEEDGLKSAWKRP